LIKKILICKKFKAPILTKILSILMIIILWLFSLLFEIKQKTTHSISDKKMSWLDQSQLYTWW